MYISPSSLLISAAPEPLKARIIVLEKELQTSAHFSSTRTAPPNSYVHYSIIRLVLCTSRGPENVWWSSELPSIGFLPSFLSYFFVIELLLRSLVLLQTYCCITKAWFLRSFRLPCLKDAWGQPIPSELRVRQEDFLKVCLEALHMPLAPSVYGCLRIWLISAFRSLQCCRVCSFGQWGEIFV